MKDRHIQRLWDKEVRRFFSGVVFWMRDIFAIRKNLAREAVSSVAIIFQTLRILNV